MQNGEQEQMKKEMVNFIVHIDYRQLKSKGIPVSTIVELKAKLPLKHKRKIGRPLP